ncbi:unnamed protein product [marine sediment metagenome]|uniref:Uncharacterized protein n=1 Tax=marine sediment metagenome TaxID=412755 RepID=X1IVD5_9ZZZZ
MEEDKTGYIIYGTTSYCIPDINPVKNEAMVPEVVDYIKKNYIAEKRFGGTLILRRKD